MEFREIEIGAEALLQQILDTSVNLPQAITTAELHHGGKTIGKLRLEPRTLSRLITAHSQNERLKASAFWPAAQRQVFYFLLDALRADIEHLLPMYLDLFNVGVFNDLLHGDTSAVVDLLEEQPPDEAGRWMSMPIIAWSLQYVSKRGTPQQKRKVAGIRRAAVPESRGAPTKAVQDHADVRIAAEVSAAELELHEAFARCTQWRKGGYSSSPEFMSRELAKKGFEKTVIQAVVPSRNLFTAAARLVASRHGKKEYRSIAEMARRGRKASTSPRRSTRT